MISSEANDIAEKEAKKTIACEHVKAALEDFGFGNYVDDIMQVAADQRKQQMVGPPSLPDNSTRRANGRVSRTARRSRARSSKVVSARRS